MKVMHVNDTMNGERETEITILPYKEASMVVQRIKRMGFVKGSVNDFSLFLEINAI